MASILKNTSSLFVAHLAGRLLAFVLMILLPHYYPDVQVGLYLWAAAVTNIVGVAVVFGMHVPLIREIAIDRGQAPRYLGNALLLRLGFAVVGLAALGGLLALQGRSPEAWDIVLLLGAAEMLNVIAQLFRCAFRAFEQMHFEAIIVLLERLFVFGVGGALVVSGFSLRTFCLVILVAAGLNVALSLGVMLRRFTPLSLRPDRTLWRELLAASLPFALGGVFNIVYFRIATVLLPTLSRHDGDVVVAWFGLAYTLVMALTILPGAFTNAIFPVLSRLHETSHEAFRSLYTRAFKWMLFLALPLALGLSTLTHEVVALLWGLDRYPVGTIDAAMRPLAWAGALMFLNSVVGIVLRAADRRLAFVLLIGGGMVANVLLNGMLVPSFDHRGAAWAMVFSEAGMFLAGFGYLTRTLVSFDEWRFLPKAALGAGVLTASVLALRPHLPLGGTILVSGGGYLGTLRLLGELQWHDFSRIGEGK